MSNELKQFYREILDWINSGCNDHPIFDIGAALCSNLAMWSNYNKELYKEQKVLMARGYGEVLYPFNTCLSWAKEMKDGAFYKNQKRLAFIEEHAK